MDQIFTRSLSDIVKVSRTTASYDQLTFQTQLITDIKNEIQNKSESVRLQALLKLFFLSMEGNQIKWAEFLVISQMGSPEPQIRITAFLLSHLVLDNQSQGLIMVTNILKKEFKSNYLEASSALSCFGAIANKDLGEQLFEEIISQINHSKPIIRKKVVAVLSKIFTESPQLIPSNLDKIVQLLKKESNVAVLACGISLFSQVMKVTPSIYPLIIPIVYDLLTKQKSNWLLIKLIRFSNKLIEKEPRFKQKLIEPYTRLLNQTSSKSLQYELIYSVMRFFKDYNLLFDSASDILKQFLNHQDENLRSLGLECLVQIQNSDGINAFQDQLIEGFKKGDYFYKLQILQILKEYTTEKNSDIIIDFLLSQYDIESNSKVIEALIQIIQMNKFSNVNDPEKLMLQQIPIIAKKIDSIENAEKLRDLIFELLIRVPDLQIYSHKIFMEILNSFSEISLNHEGPTLNIIQRSQQIKYSLNHREVLFKTLVMITGESTRLLDIDSLNSLFNYLHDGEFYLTFENSILDLDQLIFKLVISSAQLHKDVNQLNQQIQKSKIIYQKLHQLEIIGSQLLYESILFQEDFSLEHVQKYQEIFNKELPPIHADAQRMIKRPVELDEPFEIDLNEIQLITQSDKQQQSSQNLEQKPPQEQEKGSEISKDIELQKQNQNDGEKEQQQVQEQPKQAPKQMRIIKDDILPPGISQNDVQQFNQDD